MNPIQNPRSIDLFKFTQKNKKPIANKKGQSGYFNVCNLKLNYLKNNFSFSEKMIDQINKIKYYNKHKIEYLSKNHEDVLNITNWNDYCFSNISDNLNWVLIIDRDRCFDDEYGPLIFENNIEKKNNHDGVNYIKPINDALNFAKNLNLSNFHELTLLHTKSFEPHSLLENDSTAISCIIEEKYKRKFLKNAYYDEKNIWNNIKYNFIGVLNYCSFTVAQMISDNLSNREVNYCNMVINFKKVNPYISYIYDTIDINDKMFGIRSQYDGYNIIEGLHNKFYTQYTDNINYIKFSNINDSIKHEAILKSIALYISQIECSHFFPNGNNRLCMIVLLNKLLEDNDFPPCALLIPNGTSHLVLCEYYNNKENIDIINAKMPKTIYFIKEGIKFMQSNLLKKGSTRFNMCGLLSFCDI